MIRAHGVEAVRRAETTAMRSLPDGALMQRAAAALAAETVRLLGGAYGRRVILLVGPGNNGGDALWAGVGLVRRGARVDALLATDSAHEAGLAALRAAGGRVGDDGSLGTADVVLDGLLGIGGRPGLTGRAAELAGRVPPGVPVVAVDVPSGLDAGSGAVPASWLRPDLTVTFGTVKPCLLLPPAADGLGAVSLVDIGLETADLGDPDVERLERADVPGFWPVPGPRDDKYSRGVVGVVAGGQTYTGAAVLCTGAAVRAGAGMVRYVGPPHPTELVRARWPEVVPGEGRVQAWVVGPGVDPDGDDQRPAVEAALASDDPCLVDAGALAALGRGRSGPTLATPHAGELARWLTALGHDTDRDAVEREPLEHARRAAGTTGATVLLKGATTLVVSPDGPVRSQPDGPHWLATAGSGDVLAGIAGCLLAAGLAPLDAGSLAALAHGEAGRLASAGGPASAGGVLDALPAAVARLLSQ